MMAALQWGGIQENNAKQNTSTCISNPPSKNTSGSKENPSVFSCPPDTFSAYKVGTWFFFFSCFREAVKGSQMLPDRQLPHHLEAASLLLAQMCSGQQGWAQEKGGKQSGGSRAVTEPLLGASISHLPLGWDIPSSGAAADPGKWKRKAHMGWELELKKMGRKHKWVSTCSFKLRLNLSSKPDFWS